MPHTALFLIIHNSLNNMPGIVFIIILCRGKVENPGLDLILHEDRDGCELPGWHNNYLVWMTNLSF